MPVTPEEIQQIAQSVRLELFSEMKREGLVMAPRDLVESRLAEIELQKKQKKALAKPALEFREISEAQLWGEIDPQAVRAYANKYAKKLEIFPANKGNLKRYKIIRAAVIRLAKKRGYALEI
jgi:hypothetical protein